MERVVETKWIEAPTIARVETIRKAMTDQIGGNNSRRFSREGGKMVCFSARVGVAAGAGGGAGL